jgi:hypothetical protein
MITTALLMPITAAPGAVVGAGAAGLAGGILARGIEVLRPIYFDPVYTLDYQAKVIEKKLIASKQTV